MYDGMSGFDKIDFTVLKRKNTSKGTDSTKQTNSKKQQDFAGQQIGVSMPTRKKTKKVKINIPRQ